MRGDKIGNIDNRGILGKRDKKTSGFFWDAKNFYRIDNLKHFHIIYLWR